MLRFWIRFSALFVALLSFLFSSAHGATEGERQIGLADCKNGASSVDFDTLAQCSSLGATTGTFQKAPLFVGKVTSPPYGSVACDAAKAGMLQWTGSVLSLCDGTAWSTVETGQGGGDALAPDPYAASVVSLLHFEGGIHDQTGKIWTAKGGANATNLGAKFGSGSLYLSGSAQDLSTPMTQDFNFGKDDFTIDWWEFRTNTSYPSGAIFAIQSSDEDSSSYNASLVVGWIQSGFLGFYASSSGKSWDIAISFSMGAPIAKAWAHYALVRKGNVFYTFQNGALIGTVTSSANLYFDASYGVYIGGRNVSYVGGYIDELRVTKGVARWISDFPPPNQAQRL